MNLFDSYTEELEAEIERLRAENERLRSASGGSATARHTDPDTSKAARKEWDGTVRSGTQHHALLHAARFGDIETDRDWCRRAQLNLETGSPWKRVSELLQHGYLVESGTIHSEDTGKLVRTSRITSKGSQVLGLL